MQRIPESGLLECRIPPQRPHPRRGTHRLRNGAVEIKHDRLHRLAERRIRIFFLQAPALHQVTRERLIVGLGKILKAGAAESDPGILLQRLVSGCGQGHKRMVLADTQGMWIGLVQIALGVCSESQQRFHFGVERKTSGVFQINHAALFVQPPICGLRRLLAHHHAAHGTGWPAQLRKQVKRIADEQGIGIHQHRAIVFGFDRKRSQHGSWETVFHGMLQLGRAVGSDETAVLFDHQHAHPNAPKTAHRARSERTPVGEGLDRADAAAQSGEVEKLSLERRRR